MLHALIQREKKRTKLTAHRERRNRDTKSGVRSQPEMQCTNRPLLAVAKRKIERVISVKPSQKMTDSDLALALLKTTHLLHGGAARAR